jgi:membrane-associated phospholipid phosphatase
MRRFNERMLDSASIHVNTFPSGHAAEGMAAALLVLGAPLPFVAAVALAAFAVAAGAVYGRYHYAADAILGWVVAVAVWELV